MCLVISSTYRCMHQQSTSAIARKREKTSNLDYEQSLPFLNSPFFEQRKAQMNSATIPWKIFFYWIPFNEKDEKPHMARLEDYQNTTWKKAQSRNTHVPLYTDIISMYSITYDPLPSCDLENDLTAGTNPQTVKWCAASFFIFYFLFIVWNQ